jgi:hypothetical protein
MTLTTLADVRQLVEKHLPAPMNVAAWLLPQRRKRHNLFKLLF